MTFSVHSVTAGKEKKNRYNETKIITAATVKVIFNFHMPNIFLKLPYPLNPSHYQSTASAPISSPCREAKNKFMAALCRSSSKCNLINTPALYYHKGLSWHLWSMERELLSKASCTLEYKKAALICIWAFLSAECPHILSYVFMHTIGIYRGKKAAFRRGTFEHTKNAQKHLNKNER